MLFKIVPRPASIALLAVAALLAACAQRPPGAQAPVVVEGAAPPAPDSAAAPGVGPAPLPPGAPPQPARQLADGAQLPAVTGLLGAADRALARGDVELAAANLERAQRLAPQSALVYQRLAKVKLEQKRPAEAEQLARKALAFAVSPTQQAALWRLIASARQQQGRQAAAGEAAARAAALEASVPAGAP